MTLEQIQSLTDDEIRVRVAEIVGWKNVHRFDKWKEGGTASHKDGDLVGDFDGRTRRHLPNYPADLNACADMEKVLHGKAHPSALTEMETKYRDRLAAIMGCAWYQSAKLLRATARQRCEAFVTVMGKDTP